MTDSDNRIYYFGDLDYERIGIYENLANMILTHWRIEPFLPAYQAMLLKTEHVSKLPKTSEKQNRKSEN